jgi:hypothetical protein
MWTAVKFQSMLKNVDREDLSPNQLSASLKINQDLLSWLPSGVTGYLGTRCLTVDKAKKLFSKGKDLMGQGTELFNNAKAGIEESKNKADEAVAGMTNTPEAPKEGESEPKGGEAQPQKEGGD